MKTDFKNEIPHIVSFTQTEVDYLIDHSNLEMNDLEKHTLNVISAQLRKDNHSHEVHKNMKSSVKLRWI